MARPTSFRLPADLLDRIEEEARSRETTVTSLVAMFLDEGLKTRSFPGIVYRDGPAGRRAGLIGGPDIWEIVRELQHAPGKDMERVEVLATELELPLTRVVLAADFYAANPDEIDRMIAEDERAATRARQLIKQREKLLSQ
jgi:hypothetical protein